MNNEQQRKLKNDKKIPTSQVINILKNALKSWTNLLRLETESRVLMAVINQNNQRWGTKKWEIKCGLSSRTSEANWVAAFEDAWRGQEAEKQAWFPDKAFTGLVRNGSPKHKPTPFKPDKTPGLGEIFALTPKQRFSCCPSFFQFSKRTRKRNL